MLDSIFLQISVLLGLTVTIAFFVRMLRQPLMIAYLIAGIVAGPLMLNILQGDTELFKALAEFGVVLLLFVVGLSLNFDHIKKIGKVSLIVGFGQIIFTSLSGFIILTLLGWSTITALYLAIAMTFSSTIVIVKLLNDKRDTQAVYGRYVFGLMIVQDIIAITVMIVVTSLSGEAGISATIASLILKAAGLIAIVVITGKYIIPVILKNIAASSEYLFIFTIAWCFGMATLLHWLGFSLEIGAIIAGLTLGSSEFQSEISSRIRPLRDFFIVIFFVILGSELSFTNINEIIGPGIILSIFILLGNPFILFVTFGALHFTRRNSFLAGITAAQVSEFGFVVLLTAINLGHIDGTKELSLFTFVALVTIILSSYAITYNEQLYRLLRPIFELFGPDIHRQKEEKTKYYKTWLFGYHRVGWKVAEALTDMGDSFAVVDYHPKALNKLHRRGLPAYFGDAADVEFLETLHIRNAKLIISTLPEADDQKTLIRYIRNVNKKAVIIATLYHTDAIEELYKAGANYVLLPHLLGGEWLSNILMSHPRSKRVFASLKKAQREDLRLRHTDHMVVD